MKKVANYNLNEEAEREQTMKYFNKNDEIGEIFRSMKTMVDNLKEIVEHITSHASNTVATDEELTATAQSTNESAVDFAHAL